MVFYGVHVLEWQSLKEIALMNPTMRLSLFSDDDQDPYQLKTLRLDTIIWLDHWRDRFQRKESIPLLSVLLSFVSSMATMDKDKIFAILGFTDEGGVLENLIDYSKSKQDILLELARHFIEKGQLLQTLPFAGLARSTRSLYELHSGTGSVSPTTDTVSMPSWVADWMVSRPLDTLTPYGYGAGSAREPRVAQAGEHMIRATGISMDRIRSIVSCDMFDIQNSTAYPTAKGKFQHILNHFHQIFRLAEDTWPLLCYDPDHNVDQPLMEAVSRTLIGDIVGETSPAPDEYSCFIPNYINFCTMQRNELRDDSLSPDFSHLDATDAERLGAQLSQTEEFLSQMMNAKLLCDSMTTPRRFCVTKRGYFGVVPKAAEIGDKVVVFYGGNVPFLLRPSTKGSSQSVYQLVGECYLHGCMQGQALRLGLQEKDYILE
jgi:hypothetical protein